MSTTSLATQMQLMNTRGLDDELTKNPETSLFSYNFKRITPFAKHTTIISFNEKVDYGRTISATIPCEGGDLAGAMHIWFNLPPLTLPPGSTFVGYTQTIGYAMIEYVEIRIGETVIDRHSGVALEQYDYLSTNANKSQARYRSVGRYDTVNVLSINALAPQSIYVPLQFWFNKKLAASLPLTTLAGQVVKIVVRLKPFSEIVTYDGTIPPIPIPITNSGLLVDYYMLGEDEKRDLKEEEQVYLIEQWQETSFEIPRGMTSSKFDLEFTNCVKEIIFSLREIESEVNNDWFNFGRRDPAYQGGEFLEYISFNLDGHVRLENLPESYYRLVLPQAHHSFAGNRNIYTIPFSQFPELNQPSGTINMSLNDTKELVLDFIDNVPNCRLIVMGISYNKLTIYPDGAIQVEYI